MNDCWQSRLEGHEQFERLDGKECSATHLSFERRDVGQVAGISMVAHPQGETGGDPDHQPWLRVRIVLLEKPANGVEHRSLDTVRSSLLIMPSD
jgi:hypothetical protein